MTEQRYKEIMNRLGRPNSVSIQQALMQVANEVAQEWQAKLIIAEQAAFARGRQYALDANQPLQLTGYHFMY